MKTNRFFTLFFILILTSIVTHARGGVTDIKENDIFQIRKIHTSNNKITIGNKVLGLLDEFKASEYIKWSNNSAGEYIRVCNLRTKSEITIGAEDFKITNTHSVSTFIRERYMYDKGSLEDNFGDILDKYPWNMYNSSLRIFCPYKLDKTQPYIELTLIPGGTVIKSQFDDETNELVISLEYLSENNIDINVNSFIFKVSYITNNRKIPITNRLLINIF